MAAERFVVVMGVCGAGKTTVARQLALRLGASFLDADDFHTEASKQKMAEGRSLGEAERVPWLAAIRRAAQQRLAERSALVLACSALRLRYRQALKIPKIETRFLLLEADEGLLRSRLASRKGHFADERILAKQLETLEPLRNENGLTVDAAKSPEEICDEFLAWLEGSGS